MQIGDTVVRKSYNKDIAFKIIDIRKLEDKKIYILKGVNLRIVADAEGEDLEETEASSFGSSELLFDKKINESIRSIIYDREEVGSKKKHKTVKSHDRMTFKRPGKVLHIDGDANYLEVCMKVYKQLAIEAVGRLIIEKEQPFKILDIVKEVKPDIVIITGHDGISKNTDKYMDLENYRNSKYFVESVAKLRDYEPSYDNLIIYAGACQSFYEAILDAGANFASSPERTLIHCLDPVFLCEKIAYTNITEIVDVYKAVGSTITGSKGVGGIETRGKCRKGFPRSKFV